MNLGNKITKLRKKEKISQEILAEKIGVTRQTISNWELNETQPNPEQLKLLSKALNVSVDDLIGKGFAKVCDLLPFESALNIIKGILNNGCDIISARNIIVFSAYTIIVLIISIIVFKKKMVSDNK